MELIGSNNKVLVYTSSIEDNAKKQIIEFLNSEPSKNSTIRIMPDVHAGAGCVIGFTMTLNDKIIPNLVGVDIGCGVVTSNLGKPNFEFLDFDNYLRNNVPTGFNIRKEPYEDNIQICKNLNINYDNFIKDINKICNKLNIPYNKVLNSIGTLGGGNHFIELDKDEDNDIWLTIHSGSRNFGKKLAEYHQNKAKYPGYISKEEYKELKSQKYISNLSLPTIRQMEERRKFFENKKDHGIVGKSPFSYLENENKEEYLYDMNVAQKLAQINRYTMTKILTDFFKLNTFELTKIESIHNYVDFDDGILRKGAISAQQGKDIIIPFNMKDGLIIGKGKGNSEWNFSAPHGAGRVMGRREAKKNLNLDDFKNKMQNIWSSCININTLDESPDVYKSAEDIIKYLDSTVEIKNRMFPVYNYKVCDETE